VSRVLLAAVVLAAPLTAGWVLRGMRDAYRAADPTRADPGAGRPTKADRQY
jgi:hypothetical protein